MRQDGTVRSSGPNGNTSQMLVGRNRTSPKMISWYDQEDSLRGNNHPKWIDEMTDQQKLDNTTRGLTPGLINPALGEAGGRIPFPDRIKGAGVHKEMVLGGGRKRQPKKAKGDDFDAGEEHGNQCIGQPSSGSPGPEPSPLLSDTPIAPLQPSKRRKIHANNDVSSHQSPDSGTFRQSRPRQSLAQNQQMMQSISPYEPSTDPTPTSLHRAIPYTNRPQPYGHRTGVTAPHTQNHAVSLYPRHDRRGCGVYRPVPTLTRQDAFYVSNEGYEPRLAAPQNVQNGMTNPESFTDWLDNVFDFSTAAPQDTTAGMDDPALNRFNQQQLPYLHFPSSPRSTRDSSGEHPSLSAALPGPSFEDGVAPPGNVPDIPKFVAPPVPMHPLIPWNAPTIPSAPLQGPQQHNWSLIHSDPVLPTYTSDPLGEETILDQL